MKKGISKNKVQRMRNLVTGDYTSKTTVQSGYNKASDSKKKEGDVWKENGKTWTIKNGIKQTITKLDKARDYNKVPMYCPKCDVRLNKPQHKFMYRKFKHCLLCQAQAEQDMRDNGTYEAWKNEQVSINFENWLRKSRDEFKDWLVSRKAKKQITEAGDIEDWRGGKSDEVLIEEFDIYIQKEKEKLNEVLSSEEQ